MSTITTRSGKGSALTHTEVDANFNNLNNDKLEGSSLSTDNVLIRWDSGTSKLQETGITVDDSDNISGFNFIDFDEIATPSNPGTEVLRMYAADENGFGTLHFVNSDGIDYELGRDRIFSVRNNSGSVISKGKWVYVTGAQGSAPTVDLAQADAEATAKVLGIVVADIADNSFGRVLAAGDAQNINTASFNEGDTLYLSTSSAGDAQTTKPTGTDQIVRLGTVIKANAGSGIIEVNSHQPLGVSASKGVTGSDANAVTGTAGTNGQVGQWNGDGDLVGATIFTGLSKIEAIRKASAESVSTSTTLQDDDELTFSIAANETVIIDCVLFITSNSTADFKAGWSVPSGATGLWGYVTRGAHDPLSNAGSLPISGTEVTISIRAVVVNSSTAGNVTLQWAQDTSDGVSTTVEANSHMLVHRL